MPRKNNPLKPAPAPAPTLPSPESGAGLERGRERVNTRCGYVALIGAPNAGKSTLLNQLVGRKLAIVTPKVQTTRSRLLGIAIEGEAQLVLVDTPGIFAPRRRLDRAMVAAAWAGAADADATVLLVDAARPDDPDTAGIVSRLKQGGRRAILALNKVDLVRRAGQRAIVLGDKGQRIKSIGARARAELERLLERRVHLFLFVKVRDDWIEDRERFAAIGLDYDV